MNHQSLELDMHNLNCLIIKQPIGCICESISGSKNRTGEIRLCVDYI